MTPLYISQQGCYVSLKQEQILVKQDDRVLQTIQLPLLEQILIFGQSQLTTQVVRACLQRDIPIIYLSRMGYCYGRTLSIQHGYRQLARYQQQLEFPYRLLTARQIVRGKLKNSRVLLMRQQRRMPIDRFTQTIDRLEHLSNQVKQADSLDQLMGLEGAGAAAYFPALGNCLTQPDFPFITRNRRPPKDPVNAMLSFGYQVLWNHLLSLIELQGLDPYLSCLHQGHDRHAALASDLIEEFRAPIVDSLILQLVNNRIMNATQDFVYRDGVCYLNDRGRPKYLRAFLQRMEETIQSEDGAQPRWDLLSQQVKQYKQFIYNPVQGYQPYLIR